ncbi:RNA-guided pseudouridylation complex pseudouridine synthase subunit Cbf5 [Candidatus Micrarchaeota archaeon]|nr:RNA-guided pseudouridylation complex pseudouridine synthase subunit Cbf5 [Candidatus Micrarchaeota archaeon]
MITIQKAKSDLGVEPNNRSIEEQMKYGIVVIDKPIGPSSHEVSAFARKILNLSVTGHTGTLDQNVSGVLVVLLENSRKVVNFLPNTDKKYVCLMRLNREIPLVPLEKTFDNFRGEIYQKPPLQSAVAKKLRTRKIHSLKILEIKGNLVLFECECEAGTYIRKIVSDAAEILGVRAEMAELRRIRAGEFSEKDAISLQTLTDYYWAFKEKGSSEKLQGAIFPVEILKFKKIVLLDEAIVKIKSGVRPKAGDVVEISEGILGKENAGIYTGKGELVAICETTLSSSEIKRAFDLGKKEEIIANIIRVIHPF